MYILHKNSKDGDYEVHKVFKNLPEIYDWLVQVKSISSLKERLKFSIIREKALNMKNSPAYIHNKSVKDLVDTIIENYKLNKEFNPDEL